MTALLIDPSDPAYVSRMERSLRAHYFSGVGASYFETPYGQDALADHVSRRYGFASRHAIPWLRREFDLSGMNVIEVGSGTGSSTLALAQAAKSVECYEIASNATAVAKDRLDFWQVDNVRFHEVLFDEACDFARSGAETDAVVLFATLEHMTHEECLSILALSWRIVRPGGIVMIGETPNRFCPVDDHSSWLPLFSALPREIQVRYADRSPRDDFRQAINTSPQPQLAMTRWGSGISFHEFELAIGSSVHDYIVLDGHEPEIASWWPRNDKDAAIELLFEIAGVQVHRAFARRLLFLVLQKPAVATA